MTPPAPLPSDSPSPVALDSEGRIAAELHCSGCGYLLRMRRLDSDCPECGQPVAETVSSSNLRLLEREWLRRVSAGAICLALAVPTMLVFGLGMLLWIVGVITMMASPPPQRKRLRILSWIALLGGLTGAAGFLLIFALGNSGQDVELWLPILFGLPALGWSLHLFAAFAYPAIVCREAGHRAASVFGWTLAGSGGALPLLAGFSVLSFALSFSYGYAGYGIHPALELLFTAMAYITVFGGMLFTAGQFVFWIIVAVIMRRILREADVWQQRAT